MLIPSIDLMQGKAVQLVQGQQKVIEREDVFALLESFSTFGEVAIIDLDAAMGKGNNRELIKQLLKLRSCRVGGGIRDLETAQDYLKSGASKIIIGTCCQQDWVKKIDPGRLIFAIDAKGDYWTTQGWQTVETQRVLDLIPKLAKNCSEFLYTQVEKEGLLQGIDKKRITQVIQACKTPMTIAGGITSLNDIQWLANRGANAQIGMSIYSGKLSLVDCFISQLNFEKMSLIPTIVQDIETDQILMLAYSNVQSLRNALTSRKGIYWSRSRNCLWEKGATSGNGQMLVQADIDCDGDSLLFRVKQTNQACHLERYSCFGSQTKKFNLLRLSELLQKRKTQNKSSSYTCQLFQSENLRAEKLREEVNELIEARSPVETRWEAADLLFFTLVDALAKDVDLNAIVNELGSRFAGEFA